MNTMIMSKLHLTFFINIFSLTFLTWISHRSNEVNNLNKYLKIKCNKGNTWKIRNDRLLTNDDPQSEIEQSSIKENLKEPVAKNKLKDITDSSEIHEKIEKNTSNSIHTYIKELEHEYPNKKGLKRLDCHYEKKLFAEMYKLDKISGHMKSKNCYFKKVILKRYGLRYFIFSLVILIGIVEFIVCKLCDKFKKCEYRGNTTSMCSNTMENVLLGTNGIIFIPFTIVFLSFFLYILSKVEKYKKLKKRYRKIREK